LAAALVALAVVSAGCVDDGAVTLPANRNTLKSRKIVVDLYTPVAAPADRVRALNGINGAPAPLHPELPDLRVAYWRKSGGGADPDGAHVARVRVGGDGVCALSLDGVFPGAAEALPAPSAYRFAVLDAQLASVGALGGARATWRAARAAGECPVNPTLDAPGPRTTAVVNTVRHLTLGSAWDPAGLTDAIDVVELPLALIGPGADEAAFSGWGALAVAVRGAFPSADALAIAGPDVLLDDADADALVADTEPPAIAAFIAYCAAHGSPLDALTYRTKTEHAAGVQRISAALRARLDAAGLGATRLVINEMLPAQAPPWDDPALTAARLGAFEAAARVFVQDVPVDEALSGRGPVGFADGGLHTTEALTDLSALLVPSPYFDLDGAPTPAFMARFPLRQIPGQARVRVVEGPDEADLAVLASHPEDRPGALRLIIADAEVGTGSGSVTWELRVPAFVAPAVRQVDYRLALLDQKNASLPSFFFSEVGTLVPDARTGDVTLSRVLPIPGVHYLEIDRPQPR
jgi:hypothetical protein